MPRPRTNRYLQQELLNSKPMLKDGQQVALVKKACGENIYEVENGEGDVGLYRLPKRLRHVAFIRRGMYVFVKDDDTCGQVKVRGAIEAVVMERFLNELRSEPFWPKQFSEPEKEPLPACAKPNVLGEDEEEEEEDDDWEIGGANPNRGGWHDLEDEGSEEDE